MKVQNISTEKLWRDHNKNSYQSYEIVHNKNVRQNIASDQSDREWGNKMAFSLLVSSFKSGFHIFRV